MRLSNVSDVNKFINAVNSCKGTVLLKSEEGDIFNLKSSLSQYIAIGELLKASGDKLELYAERKEDEDILLNLLFDLAK